MKGCHSMNLTNPLFRRIASGVSVLLLAACSGRVDTGEFVGTYESFTRDDNGNWVHIKGELKRTSTNVETDVNLNDLQHLIRQ